MALIKVDATVGTPLASRERHERSTEFHMRLIVSKDLLAGRPFIVDVRKKTIHQLSALPLRRTGAVEQHNGAGRWFGPKSRTLPDDAFEGKGMALPGLA